MCTVQSDVIWHGTGFPLSAERVGPAVQELQAALSSSADTLASMQFQVESRTQRAEQLQADLSFAKAELTRLQAQLETAAQQDK